MKSHNYKEEWKSIQGWYIEVTGVLILPTKDQISHMTKSNSKLLTSDIENNNNENISSYLNQDLGFNVYDDIPNNYEIS